MTKSVIDANSPSDPEKKSDDLIITLNEELEKIVREYVVKGTDVRFDSPEKGKVSKPVISIYLYDIQENLDMRTSFGGFPKANNKSIYPAADPYYNAEGTVNVTCRYLFTFWESEANGASL